MTRQIGSGGYGHPPLYEMEGRDTSDYRAKDPLNGLRGLHWYITHDSVCGLMYS